MKLARFRHSGTERWGVVDTDRQVISPVDGAFAQWAPELTSGAGELTTAGDPLPLDQVQLLAPIERTATVFGVGLNYWSHLEKLGQTQRPASTMGFVKPRAAIIGPDAEIKYPSTTSELDFEIELVAVVGNDEINVADRPTVAVLGYTVGNDTSARDAKSPVGGLDLYSMKGLDRATPLGPWIVTKDEVGGAGQPDIEITLRVNGETRQRDRTKNMLWNIDECLDYVRTRTSLAPGDVVFTGTTDGVAAEDGRWLQPGDVVESEIEGIGTIRNVVGPRQG
jgi:2-keto-4-pentenoate hydratase/2-oxohepta-3-ene-1,7-dioic acid hydratase in catechol pathway